MAGAPGPVALAGSGEFLPVMADLDRALLDGRPPRVAVVPTAAGLEGEARIAYWVDLATAHYASIGADVVPVLARDRDESDDDALASLVEGAGLVYLSGGNPGHLVRSLRGTALWNAIHAAWQAGAALAGCSAGAIALSGRAVGLRSAAPPEPGLGVVPNVVVLPHFDRVRRWAPDIADRIAGSLDAGLTAIGIDEDTAIHSTHIGFRVHGRGRAWVLSGPQSGKAFAAGELVGAG